MRSFIILTIFVISLYANNDVKKSYQKYFIKQEESSKQGLKVTFLGVSSLLLGNQRIVRRNLIGEKFRDVLIKQGYKIECSNRTCTKKVLCTDVNDHEAICRLSRFYCPNKSCLQLVTKTEMFTHGMAVKCFEIFVGNESSTADESSESESTSGKTSATACFKINLEQFYTTAQIVRRYFGMKTQSQDHLCFLEVAKIGDEWLFNGKNPFIKSISPLENLTIELIGQQQSRSFRAPVLPGCYQTRSGELYQASLKCSNAALMQIAESKQLEIKMTYIF